MKQFSKEKLASIAKTAESIGRLYGGEVNGAVTIELRKGVITADEMNALQSEGLEFYGAFIMEWRDRAPSLAAIYGVRAIKED